MDTTTRNRNPLKMRDRKPISINGSVHTLWEWSQITGIGYDTLRKRYQSGCRGEQLISRLNRGGRPLGSSKQSVADPDPGYNEDELYVLYRFFAGERNELQKLADFIGCNRKTDAMPLLKKFKERYKKDGP